MSRFFNNEAFKRIFSKKNTCENYKYKDRAFVLASDEPSADISYFDTKANWKRILFTVLVLFSAVFIQESVFTSLRFFNVKAGLFIVVLSAIATCTDFTYSVIIGAASGFIIDIAYGRYLGFYAIIFMYFSVLSSAWVTKKRKGKPFDFFWFAPFVFFAYGLIESVLSRLLTMYNSKSLIFYENFGEHVFKRLLPEALYNGLLFMILIWPITFIWAKLGKKYISRRKMFRK